MDNILLIASANKNKLKEIYNILKNIPFKKRSLDEIKFRGHIEETGSTFRENALLKAETVGRKTGLLTLAEDSGLEIDYLTGRPGIRSARYSPGTDRDRLNKVLEELNGVPEEKRSARFVCVAALFDPQKKRTYFFAGESRGYITEKPQGKRGFGYDPIFYNLDLKKTNAQATFREKNRVSHRARALFKVKEFLGDGN